MRYGAGRRSFIRSLALALTTLTATGACQEEGRVVVGSKLFTESYILGTLVSMSLERAGIPVTERFGMGSAIARQGLLTGQIDLYPEYTGTAWALYLGRSEKIDDPRRLYELVREADRPRGVIWLDRSGVNNTYALAVRRHDLPRLGRTLSQLAANAARERPRFGVDHEFFRRPDGFVRMAEFYGIPTRNDRVLTMDIGVAFESMARGQIDVAVVNSTDGKLVRYDLALLEDDRGFFPVYDLCFTIRENALRARPQIAEILRPLARRLDTATMRALNYEVDGLGKPERMVAEEFLGPGHGESIAE